MAKIGATWTYKGGARHKVEFFVSDPKNSYSKYHCNFEWIIRADLMPYLKYTNLWKEGMEIKYDQIFNCLKIHKCLELQVSLY